MLFSLILTCLFLQAMRRNNYGADQMLRSFGISIGSQFTQVEGRTLPAPKVRTKSFFSMSFTSVIIINV